MSCRCHRSRYRWSRPSPRCEGPNTSEQHQLRSNLEDQAVGIELVPPVCPGFSRDSGRLLSQLVVKTRQGEKKLSSGRKKNSAVLNYKLANTMYCKIEPGLFNCQYFLVVKFHICGQFSKYSRAQPGQCNNKTLCSSCRVFSRVSTFLN